MRVGRALVFNLLSAPPPTGRMAVLFEAVLCAPSATERKLVDVVKEATPLLAALGGQGDRPGQLAQLIALEYVVTGESGQGRGGDAC